MSATKKATANKATAKKASAKKATRTGRPASAKTMSEESSTTTEICFVMSPFGGWYDQYYTDIYCPAVVEAGLEPHRADDLYLPSAIVQDIWSYVRTARVMLADLTHKNANVFYELGLAHAIDKPVVLLSQSMEDVPFDLRALRVITYEVEHPGWGELLRQRITAALKEVLAAPQTAVLQPFRREDQAEQDASISDTDAQLKSLRREVNQLRSEVLLPTRTRPERRPREHAVIPPDEASRRIQELLSLGVGEDAIVSSMIPLGPPRQWILREIASTRGDDGTKKDTG